MWRSLVWIERLLHGPQVEKMGLEKIRVECPRFDEWVTRLETFGAATGNDR